MAPVVPYAVESILEFFTRFLRPRRGASLTPAPVTGTLDPSSISTVPFGVDAPRRHRSTKKIRVALIDPHNFCSAVIKHTIRRHAFSAFCTCKVVAQGPVPLGRCLWDRGPLCKAAASIYDAARSYTNQRGRGGVPHGCPPLQYHQILWGFF